MDKFIDVIKNLSVGKLVALVAVIVFLIGFFVYLGTKGSSSDYAILYTDLELSDAKAITERLDGLDVSYRTSKGGSEILVPVSMLNKMRIDTAELALNSKGANVGYEIFDNADSLGATSFVQNVNLVRALEGELSRTIRNMNNIQSARVHLVLPKREMFSKEEQEPSASVVVKTKSGTLALAEIQSIQKLVAAAVPKLNVKNVSIIDAQGKLLTDNYGDEEAMKSLNNDIFKLNQEKKLAEKIQSLLEKTLGDGKVRAIVNLDMDFDEMVVNEEIYDPDTQVVRSSSSITEETTDGAPQGVVSVSQNIPNGSDASGGRSDFSQSSRTEETTNYEISKIVKNKVRTSGVVTRTTVAVMVDGYYTKNENNKYVYNSRSQSELESITSLVKSAVGYDANRGDVVEVENLKFAVNNIEEEEDVVEPVFAFGLTKSEVLKISENLGVAIVAILVIFLVIKPLVNSVFASNIDSSPRLFGEDEQDDMLLSNFLNDADGVDEMVSLHNIEGRVKASSLRKINDFVERSPDEAVNIIRGWLYSAKDN
ncbi:MAG: flagellar basal-body MS-ring/collar protein FliF [Alphaproteobacteria bacterium]